MITGGAGFIGYHLAKNLSKECTVDLIDNLSRGKADRDFKRLIKEKNVRLFKLNLNDKIKIKSKDYDYIFHLAATIGVDTVIKIPYMF